MVRDTIKLIGTIIIVAVAFVAGYWPQRQKYLNAVEDLRVADRQVTEAMAHQRIYLLENLMLQVLDHTAHKESEEAHTLARQFFVVLRADMARPDMAKFRPALQQILDRADIVEKALDKEDALSRDVLREVMKQLAQLVAPPPETSDPPAFLRTPPAPQD
ncbi:MAG: hypothetical protein M1453_03450 [Acidobacteria bacterium]|nr:hypothetical protein [Acidobacteriota bacterium]MCL5287035.1 hypothetical protein [Acidobacteriota bacterium]